MRKISVALFLVMALSGAALVNAATQKADTKAVTNKTCPVMNAPASEKFRADYKGQYVYFCCKGCVTMFEKDPETYIAKLSKEDLEAIKVNDICPVTNDKITERTHMVEHEGRKVYFCCLGCEEMFKKKIAEKKAE